MPHTFSSEHAGEPLEQVISILTLEAPRLEVQIRSFEVFCFHYRLFHYCRKEWKRQVDKDDYAVDYIRYLLHVELRGYHKGTPQDTKFWDIVAQKLKEKFWRNEDT